MATGGGDATGLVAGAAPVSPTVVSEGAPLPPSQATPASVPAVAMIDAAPASVAPASTQAPLSGLPAVEAVAASQATPGSAAMGLGTPASVTRADDHHLPLAAAAIGIVFLVVLLAVGATVWALGGTGDEGDSAGETIVGAGEGEATTEPGLDEAVGEPVNVGAGDSPLTAPGAAANPGSTAQPATDPGSPSEPSPGSAPPSPGATSTSTKLSIAPPSNKPADDDKGKSKGKGKGKDKGKGKGKKDH
jgi:hypothetical protein